MRKDHKALIGKIIKKYGPVIDLRTDPEAFIDILRTFGRVFENGDGGLPGGVGSPPPCIVKGGGITSEDLMKAILKLTRDVVAIKSQVAGRGG